MDDRGGRMKFLDFFSGIGGIRGGLERAGMECVGWCEFDKFAQVSYRAIYDTEGEWFSDDVRAIEPYTPPAADLWAFGFPCQDVSIAGKREGIERGARSGLFYEIMRLLAGMREEDRPRWLLVENVKNLLSIGAGFDFLRVLTELAAVGYACEWQVLNSKDFGVPQNRERVFIVGHLGELGGREIFPIEGKDGTNPCELKEITSGLADAERIYQGTGLARTLKGEAGGLGAKTGLYAVRVRYPGRGVGSRGSGYVEAVDTASTLTAKHCNDLTADYCNGVVVAPVLTPERLNKRQQSRRMKDAGEPAFTGTAEDRHGIALLGDDIRIRRLTPRECWRLQGFTDEQFDKAKAAGISDTQLYKQAGNAVTVNVAETIGRKIMKEE